MTVSVNAIKNVIDTLQTIVDYAENAEVTKVKTQCNTYGIGNTFLSLGYNGYLDLNADPEDLVITDEDDE